MDVLTTEQRRFNMSQIRGKDTAPELLLRRGLHARGFRYRLHGRELPGNPDLVFPKYWAVIFVHGCFWHQHDCHLFKWPATRREFWENKINRNRERDLKAIDSLIAAGWRVLTVWECALRSTRRQAPARVLDECASFLNGGRLFHQIREADPGN